MPNHQVRNRQIHSSDCRTMSSANLHWADACRNITWHSPFSLTCRLSPVRRASESCRHARAVLPGSDRDLPARETRVRGTAALPLWCRCPSTCRKAPISSLTPRPNELPAVRMSYQTWLALSDSRERYSSGDRYLRCGSISRSAGREQCDCHFFVPRFVETPLLITCSFTFANEMYKR